MSKKVFSIEINGLDENIRSVDSLTEKIQNLQKTINQMKQKGVEIPVEVGSEDLINEIKKISGKIKKATNGTLPIAEEKEYAKALRDRQKALDAVNKELGDTGKNLAEYKQETKDLVAQEVKARNEAKTYANTLNGLKAALKDLNSIKGNLDLGSEEYTQVSRQILELTNRLKELEAAQGSYGRNVGNYTNSILDAKGALEGMNNEAEEAAKRAEYLAKVWEELQGKEVFSFKDIKDAGLSIKEVEAELRRINELLDTTSLNDENYKAWEQYRDKIKLVTDEIKRYRGEQVKADNQLKTQVQRTIMGVTYTWENLTVAVGDLEDKLYQLAANGKRNTEEFEAIAQAAAELKVQLRQVDYQIDSMVESSRGINKMVSYAQGFTAIAQGAQGFGQLFGMEDENSLKGLQTLQSLQSIAMALQTVKELSKQGTAFGQMMDKWVTRIEAFGVASSSVFQKWATQLSNITELTDFAFEAFDKGMVRVFNTAEEGSIGQLIDIEDNTDIEEWIEKFNLAGKEADIFRIALQEMDHQYQITNSRTKTAGDVWKEFGFTLQKIWAIMKVGGRELRDLVVNLPILNKLFPKLASNVRATADGMVVMGTGAKLASIGVTVLNLSIKALTAALAATGIFLLVEALILLVGWLSDGVKWLWEWATGNDKLVDGVTTLEGRLNSLNARLERYIYLLEQANREGRLSDLGKATAQYVEYSNAVNEAAKQLKEFIKLRKDSKKLEKNFSDDGLTQTWDFKSLEQFRSEYEKLLKAVESATDVKQQGGSWWEKFWYTKKDAKSDLGVMQKRVIQDIQDKINNLDLSKGTQELEEFFKILDEEMYATSLENIENLFPEEEWAQVLKKRLESLREFFNQAKEASAQLDEVIKARLKTIRNNETEAIKENQKREIEALKNAMDDEIEAAKGDQEIIASIRAKYQRLEQEMLDRHNKEILAKHRDLQRQIRDNYLSAEDASLIKRIQEINNERYDAIEDAKLAQAEAEKQGLKMTEQYNELILSINKKYDAEIEREKREYHKTLLEEYDKYAQEIIKIEQGIASDRLDKAKQDVDIQYNIKSKSYGNQIDYKAEISQRIEQEKEYNKYRLEVEIQYLKDKKAIDDQYTTFDRDDSLLQEEDRYKKALQSLEEFKYQGNATEEEYNKLKEKEVELHNKNLQRIQEHYQSTMEVNEKNHQGEIKDTIGQYLQEDVNLYQKYMDKVNDILSDVGRDVNIFKIMKFGDTNNKYKEALKVIKEGLKDVEKERKNIEEKYKNNEITFVDAKAAKEQLEATEKELKRGAKDITRTQKDLFGEVASQWKGMIDQWINTIGSLLQTMNDTQMQLIENQLAEIDHQLEIQEQAYEKAEELAQEHKDKMDGIEDELAEARGARRQFLIDTLAAQQAAYLEDLAAQQKAAEEKERLEKKQQQLEKKRKEQEKKSNVQQAIINTYMAVSNALAVQPWFVGLALSAIALGLGMANVSAIKNTPIYEDGGVIQGARHSQGGVKVLGGQAEVEGGEYITNRKSTAANLPLLTFINDQKRTLTAEDLMKFFASGTPKVKSKSTRMFADGGQLPSIGTEVNRVVQVNDTSNENAVYVVQVTDIINAENNLRKVQTLSGLYNEN